MAEILAGAIPISGGATVTSKIKRIFKSGSVTSATSALNVGFSVRIKHGRANVQSAATVQANGKKYKTTRAALTASAKLEAYQTDRDLQREITDYLPRFYDDFQQVVVMLKTEANEFTRVRAKLNEILDQFYVETATYGLDRWESLTDIEYLEQRSIPSRRHYINAKLRGVGTVTPALLKSIVDSFYTAEIYEEPSEYKVRIKLVGKRGIPRNLEDIEAVVNDVIPAHLQPYFEFTYLPWSEVEAAGLTWEQAEQYMAEDLEEAFLLPQN
jgi:Uncharacterised protein conserved in bacteria (DUF2313)